MRTGTTCRLGLAGIGWSFLLAVAAHGGEVDASAPRSTILSVYDTGSGLCSEMRSVTLASGENTIRFGAVPPEIDAASATLVTQAGEEPLAIHEQYVTDPSRDLPGLLAAFLGREVTLRSAGSAFTGVVLAVPDRAGARPLLLRGADGQTVAIPADQAVEQLVMPAGSAVRSGPVLHVRCDSVNEGPRNLRLSYATRGLSWQAFYDVILEPESSEALLVAKVAVENSSGGRFEKARVRLVETAKGGTARAIGPGRGESAAVNQAGRYLYGAAEPEFERAAASAAAMRTFELPRPVSLQPGRTAYAQLFPPAKVQVRRFHVYDGVRLDRFDRNPRNDWNYGTASHNTVDSYIEVDNTAENGLGLAMPRGRLTAYLQRADGAVDVAGDGRVSMVESGGVVRVQVGPAPGLRGERERTGYSEIVPLREYEETFEIRLENTSPEDVEIRVVEHLYRWHQYEIVKADTEYVKSGDRTIEFRPLIKKGGRKSVHYTVRYRW